MMRYLKHQHRVGRSDIVPAQDPRASGEMETRQDTPASFARLFNQSFIVYHFDRKKKTLQMHFFIFLFLFFVGLSFPFLFSPFNFGSVL